MFFCIAWILVFYEIKMKQTIVILCYLSYLTFFSKCYILNCTYIYITGVDTKMWAVLRSQGANSVSCHMPDLILISHAMSRL